MAGILRPPRHPDELPQTHPADVERCDRFHVERAYVLATLARENQPALQLTLCRYHFRQYEVDLRVAGWTFTDL